MSIDVLLVNPLTLRQDPVEWRLMTPYFPLGILYVAAAVREAGYRVGVYDAMFAPDDEAYLRLLRREQPKVIGLGVLATVRGAALRLASLAKGSGAKVIVGGADPTARPEVYLQARHEGLPVVDVVHMGEAEESVVELLPLLLDPKTPPAAFGEVRGIAFRDQEGQIVITPRRELIAAPDRIPFPARDLLDLEPYREAWRAKHGYFSMSLIATRGCPYQCAWCQKTVFGRSFRPRSPAMVAQEMRLIKERYRPDQLRIVDDVMGIDRAWVREWHKEVLSQDAVIPFECLSRVDLMDAELARLLREAGCRRISFGAESGSQKVLDAMTKGIQVEQVYRTAEICRREGIETYFYMMVGYPGENWSDLKRSVKLLRETRPDAFSTTIAYPLPGTPFYDQVCELLAASEGEALDWEHTAENRLLFERGQYNTFFYRRVMRWFHSEWQDARIQAGRPVGLGERVKARLALWRDRVVVNVLARLNASSSPFRARTAG